MIDSLLLCSVTVTALPPSKNCANLNNPWVCRSSSAESFRADEGGMPPKLRPPLSVSLPSICKTLLFLQRCPFADSSVNSDKGRSLSFCVTVLFKFARMIFHELELPIWFPALTKLVKRYGNFGGVFFFSAAGMGGRPLPRPLPLPRPGFASLLAGSKSTALSTHPHGQSAGKSSRKTKQNKRKWGEVQWLLTDWLTDL